MASQKNIGGRSMFGKGALVSGAVLTVLMIVLGVFAIPINASAASTNLSDKLTTATGTTSDFGGGSYFYVKFGSDAAFGVVWGNNQTPNDIYFVAIKARYLGMAQVYDSQGALVEANKTIKIYTLYAVKLDDIIEFNDSNGDGMLQAHRIYSGGVFTGGYMHTEQLFKSVSLNASWAQSGVTSQIGPDQGVWSFSLTANDLSYKAQDNYTGATGDDKLDTITLTFHLTASMVQEDNATVPQYRITVQRTGMGMGGMGGMMYSGFQQMPDMITSGKMIKYHVKWDQTLQGWDYDAGNAHPSLLMEYEAIVGNYMPQGMMSAWMTSAMIGTLGEGGTCMAREPTGQVTVGGTTGSQMPRMLTSPMLTFGGDRTRIGTFQWVSNITVDGTTMQLHSQIMGGMPIVAIRANGAVFAGFVVLGGIAYPGGNMIVHDPTFASDALVDLGSKTSTPLSGGFLGILIVVAIAGIVAVVVVVALEERKPKQKAPQTYERTLSSQPGAWAKYYQEKKP